jgi:glycosyltransferase involved in cell wall biosynthesis
MRILLLTPRLPWPPIDGGRIAMSRLAQGLVSGGADIEIVSLNPRKHRGVVAQMPVPIEVIDIETSRLIAPALDALGRGIPFIVSRFISSGFRKALIATLQRFQPDIVQIESPFLIPYIDAIRTKSSARVALRSLNVEFRIWEGLARNERNSLRRLAFRRVASSLRKYEVKHLNTPDALIPISQADADDFRDLGSTRPIHVVPCGVERNDRPLVAPEPGSVGFIGSLDFRPNQEAVRWIIDELWPRVSEQAPRARLSIAGSGAPVWLTSIAGGQNIDFLGDVSDAQAFVERMSIMIAPLFSGGGMRIKVLEAMALAKPVVATTLGAGGIVVENGRDILIADDADPFAGDVVRLLHDSDLASRIANAARKTTLSRYDNVKLARDLLDFYGWLTT